MILKEKQVGSSLDKSANLETRETSKLGIDATKPLDKKKEDFEKPKIPGEDKIKL
jgi:3-polyprenyl-4-hydroxybenzoate decarboxylase